MLFMLKMISCTAGINGSGLRSYIAIETSVLDLGSTGIATAIIATIHTLSTAIGYCMQTAL